MKSDAELTWKDIEIGSIVTEPGNAIAYRTGDWRSQAPRYNFEYCIKCGVCAVYCPEGCIKANKDGYFEADSYHCNGCGICVHEFPTGVIYMVEEEE